MTEVLLPESLPDLLNAFDGTGGCGLMAGGTDLMVAIRDGRARPERLICLERVPELHGIGIQGNDIVIGAATPLQQIAGHAIVRKHLGLLCQAIRVLGAPPIVHMATIGGNICTASPAGDTLPPLHVLSAVVELESRAGIRRLPISMFITGPKTTLLGPGEVLARVRIPIPAPGSRMAYFKVGRRKAQAIAVVSLAACYWPDADGTVRDIRLAWGSVGPVVLSFPAVEAEIRGNALSEELLSRVGAKVEGMVAPIDDIRASAAYRRKVAGNLLRKLLEIEGGVA